jgi:NTE family protein
MTPEATVTAFAIVFSLFVVVTIVLIVLTVRFTLQRAAIARARWLEGASDADTHEDEDGDGEHEGMTALVLGGGGPRGAVQIGMLQVLAEHGFVPDRIYGCSVGAMNGVGFACDPTPAGVERMTAIWSGINREHVFPQGRLHGPWLYFQQRDAVYSNAGLRKIIEDGISVERLEETVVPVEVVATSMTDGRERWFTYGPAAEAILASSAMPAIFPPIEIEGDRYVDGGVVDNVPIRRAIEAGATRLVVLLCSSPIYTPGVSKRPIEAVINALFVSINARFGTDMAQIPAGVEIILCVGSETATRDFDDFSTTEALIAHGREEASEVVRRYGLGTVPPAAPAGPREPGGGSPVAGSNGQSERPSSPESATVLGAEHVTQPEPGR